MSIRNVDSEVSGGAARTLPKKGNRPAVLVGLYDVGIHQREFAGVAKKPAREILPVYELVSDKYETEDGEKHNIRLTTYPFAIYPGAEKAKYMQFVAALDPNHEVLSKKGLGDVTKLLGRPCLVNVVHGDVTADGKQYANIKGVTELPEDYPISQQETELFFFDTTDPDPSIVERMTDNVKNFLRTSQGYVGSELERIVEGGAVEAQDDEAPFEVDEDGEDSPV